MSACQHRNRVLVAIVADPETVEVISSAPMPTEGPSVEF